MCGLFGWQWAKGKTPDRVQQRILAHVLSKEMDKRGGHAWGVWSQKLVHRGLGGANPHHELFMGHKSMFGHSRYATHGANKIENTHPFIGGGLNLSHNGVLSNHSELNTKFNRKHAVDSMHILSHLTEDKPMTDIQGYGAITWARDKDDQCIYMGLLSSSGSLCVVETEAGIVWASTQSAVAEALSEAKLGWVKTFEITPGKAYFTENGKLFEDTGHKSILISQPPVVQHWSSYTTGVNTTMWCNKHKKRYSSCPCRGSASHIVTVLTSKLPKDGETAEEYVPPSPPTPPRYTRYTGPSSGERLQPFCSRALCMERQTPKTVLCAAHQEEADEALKAMSSSTTGRGKPPFCRAEHCFMSRKNWEALFCEYHEAHPRDAASNTPTPAPAPAPIPLTKVAETAAPMRSSVARDLRAAWADGNEPSERAKHQMKCDLASFWLEDNVGGTEENMAGMTPSEVLDLATELGFDAEAAVKEALALTDTEEKAPNANPEPSTAEPAPAKIAEAGVQQQEAKHEPSDGGAACPLVNSASVGP